MKEEKDIGQDEDKPVSPSFFLISLAEDGSYKLQTNMGESWKWHALKVAKAVRKELDT